MTAKPVISLRDLQKIYTMGDQSVTAVNIPQLDISTGQWVSITGPSGSGKTTLLHLLGCLDRPTSGRYLLAGKDVATLDRNEQAQVRRTMMSFIFQKFHLLPTLTAAENVALPLQYRGLNDDVIEKRVQNSLQRVELFDRLHHYPHQLSGGQQQRVAIARSLAMQPRILFADEPTGSLDSKTGNIILQLLKEVYTEEKLTIIMVTHDPNIAKHGTRHISMKDGIIEQDR